MKENLHEQVKNTIFDTSLFVNPNQTQKYSLKTTEKLTTHFLKTHFRSLFSNFRSFAFESAISTSLDILFAKGIHIQALLHQTKQLFCESLFEAATDIPIFKNYMNMCQNIYTKAYQSKDIILEKLNFGNKHISISRCILFNWLAVGHVFFTSRKFLELKNNLNKVYRAEKDAKYQILVDTQELASLLKEELRNISQHIENRVNTIDRLMRLHISEYFQISNYSSTAKSFVQDILYLSEKTTQNLTDAYDECFVHALEIDSMTLETFENKTSKIFGNMFDALVFSIFTHPEIEQYSTKTDEIKVMLSFKRVLDDMSVFNRKEFVNMHTDFVLGAGFLANQKDIPFVKTKSDHTYNDLDKTQYIYTFLQYLEDVLFTLEYANALSKSSKLEYLICLTTYFDIIHKVFQNISKAP